MAPRKGTESARRDTSKATQAAADRRALLDRVKVFDANEGALLDGLLAEARKTEHLPTEIADQLKSVIRDCWCNLKYPKMGYDDQPVVTDTTMESLFVDCVIDSILHWSERYEVGDITHKLIVRAVEAFCSWVMDHPELESELTAEFVQTAKRALKDGLIHGSESLVKPKRKPQADVNTYDDHGRLSVVHFDGDSVEQVQQKVKDFYQPKPDPEPSQREFVEQQLRKSREDLVKEILELQKIRNLTGGINSPFNKGW
jgi:hypothetical protein